MFLGMNEKYETQSLYITDSPCETVIDSTLMYYRMEMDRRVCMAYLISVCIRLFLERRERELSQFVTLFKAASAADEKISLMERFLAELW